MNDAARPGWAVYALAVAVPVACGFVSVWLGQDANWDLRNYHFYNAYALLHGRRGFDLAVAHHATFYNPLSDLPFYALVTTLPPRAVGFAMGLLHGLNFIVLLALAWRLLATARPVVRRWASVATALLGMAGAMAVSELGTTFHDNLISLFTLGSLLGLVLYYRHLVESPAGKALAVAAATGLLAGLGAGLKQPAIVFAIGACAALLLVTTTLVRRFFLSFCYGLGVLAGIAATGGWWIWRMWQDYANPLFPYYNQFFKSPWAVQADYVNRGMLPRSWWEVVAYPFVFAADPKLVGEAEFLDLRAPVLYALALLAILAWPVKRRWTGPGTVTLADRHPANLLLAASAVAYLVWLKLFGVYRYLVPLEMLAPLLILVLADRFALTRWVHGAALGAAAAAFVLTTQPASWGRVPWADDFFGVKPPPLAEPGRTMVLLAGAEPLGYVVPFFPPEIPFLRVEGWFVGPSQPNRHIEVMRERIAAHSGPIFVLFRTKFETQRAIDALTAFGLKIRLDACRPMQPHLDINEKEMLAFCPVDRL
ncbi:MAG: hypothetical protein IT563_14740 [Alphaproteobacteria bacterium]|nr:hypothetical protein [Alphaproteobacteria bacterium]